MTWVSMRAPLLLQVWESGVCVWEAECVSRQAEREGVYVNRSVTGWLYVRVSKRVASSSSDSVWPDCRSLLRLQVTPPICVGVGLWLEHWRSWDLSKDMGRFLRVPRIREP